MQPNVVLFQRDQIWKLLYGSIQKYCHFQVVQPLYRSCPFSVSIFYFYSIDFYDIKLQYLSFISFLKCLKLVLCVRELYSSLQMIECRMLIWFFQTLRMQIRLICTTHQKPLLVVCLHLDKPINLFQTVPQSTLHSKKVRHHWNKFRNCVYLT